MKSLPCAKMSFWTLSISLAAITAAAGIVGTINTIKTEPAVAQPAPGLCETVKGSSLKTVPASVVAAANLFAAPLKVTQLNDISTSNGAYELGGVQKNGCPFEVDVFKSGKLDEIEYQLPSLNQVPASVKASLNSKVPGFFPTLIEKSVKSDGVFNYINFYICDFSPSTQSESLCVDSNFSGTYLNITVTGPTF